MKRVIYALLTSIITLSSCTKQRDLYNKAEPFFILKNDWSIAKLSPQGSTVMIYHRLPENKELMINDPCYHECIIDAGVYDMISVNEAMFSESESNIQSVKYRGSSNYATFGAYAMEGIVNPIFRAKSDGLVVGYNYPDQVASDNVTDRAVLDEKEYILKYMDGKNAYPNKTNFKADSVEFTPVRVTRDVQIIAHVKNLKSQFRVSGSLRGFAEGVLLSSRQPDGSNATFTFDMNSAVTDPNVKGGHIIVSPVFATFGPWWNEYPSSREYIIDLFASWNGNTFPYKFGSTGISMS